MQEGVTSTPLEPSKNGAGVVCMAMARDHRIGGRIRIELSKGVPIGLGMGSSGASAAAAACAMNRLFELGLDNDHLILYAGMGEAATSGAAHYDNVAASLLGGFVVVRPGERPSAIRFDAPASMGLCIVTPSLKFPERKTEYFRSVVPRTVVLGDMTSNVANASLIISGFARGDIGLIGAGMDDRVVEAARKKLIPGFDRAKERARSAGAAGVCISGAGPSMLAITDNRRCDPRAVVDAMIDGFREDGVGATGYVTTAGEGAH
jgi:homoserine kinase